MNKYVVPGLEALLGGAIIAATPEIGRSVVDYFQVHAPAYDTLTQCSVETMKYVTQGIAVTVGALTVGDAFRRIMYRGSHEL